MTDRTVGIMPVHLYGHPANVGELGALASARGLKLFEDAAQAHGATVDGRQVGTFGDFAMFSLYPTKNMTSGEGGMVSTADPTLERTLRLLRNQGMDRQYHNEIVGFNARMTDIHAAIGRVQLTKLAGWTTIRQGNAAYLSEHLTSVATPRTAPGMTHVFHQYTIRVPEDRDGFAAALKAEYAIGCGIYYPVPVHRLASFNTHDDLPVTERAAREVLSLPVHPSVGERELDRIVAAITTLSTAGA